MPYTAAAGDILIGQSRCDGPIIPNSGTISVQEELVSGSNVWTNVSSASYNGSSIEFACTRGQVAPFYAVAGRRYRVQMLNTSSRDGSRGSLLRVRPITASAANPRGNCLPHDDSGEPNWFLYMPSLTDPMAMPSAVRTTVGTGFFLTQNDTTTEVTRFSDGTLMCSVANTLCAVQANQGIPYLIESEENSVLSSGQTCVRSPAPALQVSMLGVERTSRRLSWETSSEAGTLGFIIEHDSGTGFAPVSDLLPSLSEPGGGTYSFHLSAVLTGTLRVVELDATGARNAFLVGGELVSEPPSVSAAAPFASAAHSLALATRPKDNEPAGPGDVARVLVGAEGFVRVSATELAASFGVSAANVTNAIASGALSISDGEAAVAYEVDGDGVVFFSAAPDHIFSDVRHFFVRLTGGAASPGSLDATPGLSSETDTYTREIHLEQEEFAGTVVVEDARSDFWFWHVVSSTSPLMTAFELDAPAVDVVRVEVAMHAIPDYDATVSLWLDGVMVGDQLLEAGRTRLGFEVAASLLGTGEHSLEVRAGTGFAYVDEIDLRVPTQFSGDSALFSVVADSVLTLPEADGVRIFDVSNPRTPQLLTGLVVNAGEVHFQALEGHRYLVDRGDISAPERVEGASPRDITGDLAADYVVIAHRSLLGALEPLLQARATDGFASLAVDVQDIYDEYAAGVPDPDALRMFLRDARDSWSVAPRYVLIAGHGTFDFRDVRGMGDNLVAGPMTRTTGGLYASDAMLVSDSEWSGPQLPIGRLPARTAGELSEMIGRILAYESRDHSAVLAVADYPSQGDDFARSATLATDQVRSDFRVGLVAQTGAVTEARTALLEALGESPDTVMYFGHGGLDRIGRDGMLRIEDLPLLSDSGLPAIHFTMSCSVGRFDVPGFESLSEELVRMSQGAVAVFGPSGQTNLADADGLAGPIAALLYQDGMRLGDATLQATQSFGGHFDAARLFNLLGDPAMRTGALVVVEPPGDAGVPVVDAGGTDAGWNSDSGFMADDAAVTPPPSGGLGGGSCTAGLGTRGDAGRGGVLFLLGFALVAIRCGRRQHR
jgi:hypothetical protein